MKNIKPKSIYKPKSNKDGIRICVMRRIRPEYDFDMWIPVLAPSNRLLNEYVIEKKISWEQFSLKFKNSVLKKGKVKDLLNLLINLSKEQTVTLLCGEKSAKFCHRSLIIRACENRLKEETKG